MSVSHLLRYRWVFRIPGANGQPPGAGPGVEPWDSSAGQAAALGSRIMQVHEFELLETIYQANNALPGRVLIPPGDDLGAVAIGDQLLLMGVDQVADGVHLDLANTSVEKVGHKAIARSLSDVAAMAARPIGLVAGAMLPRGFDTDHAERLFEAMRRTAANHNCPLVGGDLSIWDRPLVLSVTVFAEPGGIDPVLRAGARRGDAIYVTGQLGRSVTSGYHLEFEPRITLARQLARDPNTRPHCMIDLSDGLARDLGHLCSGAIVEASSLPLRHGVGSWQEAVGDGEDYELLFTSSAAQMPRKIGPVPITRIGTVTDHDCLQIRLTNGSMANLIGRGWEHHG